MSRVTRRLRAIHCDVARPHYSDSFDPEGLVVDPRTGHFLIADEYGPSLYEFDRSGRLVRVFETPQNLVPKSGVLVNYVATRDACSPTLLPP